MIRALRASLLLALACSLGASTATFLSQNDGFCREGAYPGTSWPAGKPKNLETWGSYCDQVDGQVGSGEFLPFVASKSLTLYLSGYLDVQGISLSLENLTDHSKLSIRPNQSPRTRWLEYTFTVPERWVGKPVRLIARDQATLPGRWLGFSEPLNGPEPWALGEAARLLLRTASHFILLFLVCFACCAYAVGKGVRDVVVLGVITLIATALPGYAAFWLWLFLPRFGHAVSFLIPFLAGASLVFLLPRIGQTGRALLRPLLLPTLLVFFSSLWILSAGFAYGGTRDPFLTAAVRFSHPLPADNMIPHLFAEGIRYGYVPTPLVGDWLSSDRPPLQTGIALSQYPYLPQPRDLGHEALAVLLQSTWILGLWVFLVALGVDRRAIGLVLATALFSGFTLVNSFFVWPKLLAAAYLLALCALLLVDKYSLQLGKSKLLCILAGMLTAFGFLSHGGSAFALIGLVLTYLVMRKRLAFRALMLMVVTCVVLYLPWTLYQKFYDPPGDRLVKLHIAGVEPIDNRGAAQTILDSYRQLSRQRWMSVKEANVMMVAGNEEEYWKNVASFFSSALTGQRAAAARVAIDLRAESFFHFSSNLGFFMIGPLFLFAGLHKRFRNRAWQVAGLLWIFVICTVIPWCVIMFNNASTSIHAGSYLPVVLAITGCVLAIWAVAPWLACLLSALQIVQGILVYGVYMRESPHSGQLLEGTLHYGMALLFLISFLVTWVLLGQLSFRANE